MKSTDKSLRLGKIVGTRRTLAMSEEQRAVHMHILGASGTGKSKFIESLIREDIYEKRGLCLIDPHGELAENILGVVSRMIYPPKNFHYIAPHRDDWTVCYNPLAKRETTPDDWFVINAMKQAVVKVWGADNTQQTPLIDEWLERCFYTAITLGLTLPEIGMLLGPSPDRNPQRLAVAEKLPNVEIAQGWIELCRYAEKKPSQFREETASTTRRLSSFLNNPRLNRIFGIPDVSLDLATAMDQGAVVIVDLSTKGRLHGEDAKLFGTLLLTDFYVQMFNRQSPDRPFTLYIDEFQNYATKDLARMLDEARKFGLRLVLAHQRPGQLQNSDSAEERDLYSAVMTNARTKVVFGGVFPDELEPIAKALSMGVLDPYKIKREIHTRGVVDFVKEYWEAHSHSESCGHTSASGGNSGTGSMSASVSGGGTGSTFDPNSGMLGSTLMHTNENSNWSNAYGSSSFEGRNWSDSDSDSESDTTTEFPVLVPVMGEQLSSVYYETLEEQLYQFMAILHDQRQRHAMVRIVGQKEPIPIVIPTIKDSKATQKQIERQRNLSFNASNFFLLSDEAGKIIAERKKQFLALDGETEPLTESLKPAILSSTAKSMFEPHTHTQPIKYENREIRPHEVCMLLDIYDGRMMTVDAAGRLYYDRERTAQNRLAILEKIGLLEAKPHGWQHYDQATKKFELRKRKLFFLTKAGFEMLLEYNLLDKEQEPPWHRVEKRFSIQNPQHELAVLDIKSQVEPKLKTVSGIHFHGFKTRPASIPFDVDLYDTRYPDGYFELTRHHSPQSEEKVYRFYLELDRGTESYETLFKKSKAYGRHQAQSGPLKALYVFVGYKGVSAQHRLLTYCEKLVEMWPNRKIEMLTTLDEILDNPLGDIWVTPLNFRRAQSHDSIIKFSLLPSLGCQKD